MLLRTFIIDFPSVPSLKLSKILSEGCEGFRPIPVESVKRRLAMVTRGIQISSFAPSVDRCQILKYDDDVRGPDTVETDPSVKVACSFTLHKIPLAR